MVLRQVAKPWLRRRLFSGANSRVYASEESMVAALIFSPEHLEVFRQMLR
jgi:hypothetical protein